MAPRERSEVNLCIKYLLFFSNFIFVLAGVAFIVAGSYVLYIKEKTIRTPIDFLFDPSVMLVFVGSVIVFIAFFGCWGSLRENTCALKTYYIVLTCVLMLEIVAIIFVFVFYSVPEVRTQIGLYPEETLRDAVVQYREDQDMQNFIDAMQVQLECCGLSNDDMGYKDWNRNQYFNCSDGNLSPEKCSVPWSCCKLKAGEPLNYRCGGGALSKEAPPTIHINGCIKGLEIWFSSNGILIGGIAIGIIIPQAIFVYLGKTLVWQVEAQKSRW